MTYTLHEGDCLEKLNDVPSGSIDLVLTDPPYGTTACKWDAVIPFEPMWKHVWRVLKPNGAAVFTANFPFSATLVCSSLHAFRYCWVWEKSKPVGHLRAKLQPMRAHEDVLVFGANSPRYFPQGLVPITPTLRKRTNTGGNYGKQAGMPSIQKDTNYPRTVLRFPSEEGLHPTQKPVALMEYLIKTYTNAGETVLDFTMGSGTTGVAAMNTGRKFIGIERDPKYFAIASDRIRVAHETYIDSLL